MAYHNNEYKRLEELSNKLDQHPLGMKFTGDNITVGGQPLPEEVEFNGIPLSPGDFARLFLLPNGSEAFIEEQLEPSPDCAPPGKYVRSHHQWIKNGEHTRVGAYKTSGSEKDMGRLGIFIDHVFFDENKAPKYLATVAFSYLALAAREIGCDEITLLAGGGGGGHAAQWGIDNMVGYFVWPKFGFDAPIEPDEAEFSGYANVAQVVAKEPEKWEKQGNGRVMRFDLEIGSASWDTLLKYACSKLSAIPC